MQSTFSSRLALEAGILQSASGDAKGSQSTTLTSMSCPASSDGVHAFYHRLAHEWPATVLGGANRNQMQEGV